jgi:hypothetical protein
MRWIALFPLALLIACTNGPGVSGDQVTLCERSPPCSAHPLPDGQNGVEWTPTTSPARGSNPVSTRR